MKASLIAQPSSAFFSCGADNGAMVLSPRTLLMMAPGVARFVAPSPARLARWRSQLKDIFHVEEVPWGTFWTVGGVMCLLGAVEISYVQPIRDQHHRSHRLQEFVTRSRLEGFDAASKS